jgi:hypothetical protein
VLLVAVGMLGKGNLLGSEEMDGRSGGHLRMVPQLPTTTKHAKTTKHSH